MLAWAVAGSTEANPAPVVAAVAACIAAGLSAATLIVAGVREKRRWRRESLVNALVDFLGATFAGAGQRVLDARLREESLDEYRSSSQRAHDQQTESLTKLRLIAPRAVVVAAEKLHVADHMVHAAALGEEDALDGDAWRRLREAQKDARETLLDEARKSLGERRGPPVTHRHFPA